MVQAQCIGICVVLPIAHMVVDLREFKSYGHRVNYIEILLTPLKWRHIYLNSFRTNSFPFFTVTTYRLGTEKLTCQILYVCWNDIKPISEVLTLVRSGEQHLRLQPDGVIGFHHCSGSGVVQSNQVRPLVLLFVFIPDIQRERER